MVGVDQNRVWLIVIALTMIWHIALMVLPWNRWTTPWDTPFKQKRMEVQTIDSESLQRVKESWKNRKFLRSQAPTLPEAQEAPENARYESDRNVRVDHEQRARMTNVIPQSRPGADTPDMDPADSTTNPAIPNLAKLGANFGLNQRSPSRPQQIYPTGPISRSGGDQYVDDPDLPEGSQNILNSARSVYHSFYARLYDAIAPVWQSRVRGVQLSRRLLEGEYDTIVTIVLDQNGALKRIDTLQSSGVPELDQVVFDSWKKIQRFPNPPRGLVDAQSEVKIPWKFTLTVDRRAALFFNDPKRIK